MTFSSGGGTGAAATAALGTEVTSVAVTNAGSGYTSPPAVTFSSGGGTGAAATAALGTEVTSVAVTNGGRGYTSAPAVTFLGGGGSGAAATAVIGEVRRRGNTQSDNLYFARRTLYGKQLRVWIADE